MEELVIITMVTGIKMTYRGNSMEIKKKKKREREKKKANKQSNKFDLMKKLAR